MSKKKNYELHEARVRYELPNCDLCSGVCDGHTATLTHFPLKDNYRMEFGDQTPPIPLHHIQLDILRGFVLRLKRDGKGFTDSVASGDDVAEYLASGWDVGTNAMRDQIFAFIRTHFDTRTVYKVMHQLWRLPDPKNPYRAPQ